MVRDGNSIVVDEGNVDGFQVVLIVGGKSVGRDLLGSLEVNVIDDHGCISHRQWVGIAVGAVSVSSLDVGIDISLGDDVIVVVGPVVGSVIEISKHHNNIARISDLRVDPFQQFDGLIIVGSILECEDWEVGRQEMSAKDMSGSNGGIESSVQGSCHGDGGF